MSGLTRRALFASAFGAVAALVPGATAAAGPTVKAGKATVRQGYSDTSVMPGGPVGPATVVVATIIRSDLGHSAIAAIRMVPEKAIFRVELDQPADRDVRLSWVLVNP